MTRLKMELLKNFSLLIALVLVVFSGNAQKGEKIDGVAVVIGKNIVLESDISRFKKELEIKTEGKETISDCGMLEELMKQKLLAHHAIIDSVVVTQSDIDSRVQRSIQYFQQQFGSEEKMLKVYGFSTVQELKNQLSKIQKENALIEKEQQKITSKVNVTPEEVRLYFNSLKNKNELPEFPAEAELAQITLNAEPTEEETKRVIAKLKEIKKQVEDGADFKLKALINSNDPSVSRNNGNMGVINKNSPFIKEFKEVAFSLDEGQISEPFKTVFGYHIILLHKIKGQGREVSHILLQPEISEDKLENTKKELEKIKKDIQNKTITFEEAVKKYSEDEDTKNSGGLIINPYTGESVFEISRMPADLFGRISELKKGDLTDVYYDETRGGEKMYRMILVKQRKEAHTADLIEDYVKIQQLALLKKKEEVIAKWMKSKIGETYIKLGKDSTKCNFKSDWKKNNS